MYQTLAQSDLISADCFWGAYLLLQPKYTCEVPYEDYNEGDSHLTLLAMAASEESLKEDWDSEEDNYWDTL